MSNLKKSAVFLDRDGVLTIPEFRDGRSFAPRTFEDFKLYPNVSESVTELKEAGFLVIVVTNQPDIGAGVTPLEEVEKMHAHMRELVAIDDIEMSTETRAQDALQQEPKRRKPGPGMLLSAADKWAIDLSKSFMVGDRLSDVEAGHAAGCVPLFIDLGYTAEEGPDNSVPRFSDLKEVTHYILGSDCKPAS